MKEAVRVESNRYRRGANILICIVIAYSRPAYEVNGTRQDSKHAILKYFMNKNANTMKIQCTLNLKNAIKCSVGTTQGITGGEDCRETVFSLSHSKDLLQQYFL